MSGTRMKHLPGARFGSLTIVERRGTVKGSGRVLCRCDCGNLKELGLPNLISGATVNCADRASHPSPASKGEAVSYHGAHHRVAAERGKAREHTCIWCKRQAEQWALAHATANVERDAEGKDKGLPYSVTPADYQPMCRRCHGRFDRRHRELTANRPDGTVSLLHFMAFLVHGGQVEGLEEDTA